MNKRSDPNKQDIVDRLRIFEFDGEYQYPGGLLDEAADEIEKLRKELSRVEDELAIMNINANAMGGW